MNLGPTELIIILVIVLLLFGGSRLPKLAKSLGQASKEFKDGVSEGHKDTADVPAKETTKGTTEP
jgi:sec-independent protein translocase protein TatA